MKKIFLLLTLLSFQTISDAQIHIGTNAILQLLLRDFKQETSFAYGGSASIGYTFDQRVDLSFVYSIYQYDNGSEFGLNSKTGEAKFFFFNGKTSPYIGCAVGIFSKSMTLADLPKYSEQVWGFQPKVGILFDSGINKNLYFDTSVSFLYAHTKFNSPKAFNLAGGLKYMFD